MSAIPGRSLISVLLLTAAQLPAQNITGTIVGDGKDAPGAAVPAAVVTVTNLATNQPAKTLTGPQGHYGAPYLRRGAYQVRARAPGFTTAVRDQVTLDADSRLRVIFPWKSI